MVAPGAVKPRACAAIRREIGLAGAMLECLDVVRVVVVGDAVVGGARRVSRPRICVQCYTPKF